MSEENDTETGALEEVQNDSQATNSERKSLVNEGDEQEKTPSKESKGIKGFKMRRGSTSALLNNLQSSKNDDKKPSRRKSLFGITDKRKPPKDLDSLKTIDEDEDRPISLPKATPRRKSIFKTITSSPIHNHKEENKKKKLRKVATIAEISTDVIEHAETEYIEENILEKKQAGTLYEDIGKLIEENEIQQENNGVFEDDNGEDCIEFGRAHFESETYGYDIIIQEIETGVHFGPTLRAVYEGNDHQKFLNRLDTRIKQHDKSIETMCNFYYQGFIESITELINVRGDAEKLKSQTLLINKELHDSGNEVVARNDNLIQCRSQQRNVASAIEKLTACLPVLQMYAKVCEQLKEERYYAALKALDQLEATYLPQMYQYRFCDIMKNKIPHIRIEIKEKSIKLLNDFLEDVRKKCSKIGKVAMRQVEEERDLDEKSQEADELYLKKQDNSNVYNEIGQLINESPELSARNPFSTLDQENAGNPFEDESKLGNPFEEEEINSGNPFDDCKSDANEINALQENETPPIDEKDLSASDIVDFSPVYKCLHIFGLVQSREWFEQYYRKQRNQQVRLILEKSDTSLGSVDSYVTMFHEIVGFFVVEDHILHTAQNLVTTKYINDLWDMVLLHLLNKLVPNQMNFPDAASMMQIKNIIVVFADTLKAYGFSVDRLFGLLMEMRDTYGEMMLKLWQERFEQVFNQDNYTPIYLESSDDIDDTLLNFPFEENEFEGERAVFPKKLDFSLFVPKIYNEIKEFILACLKYCEDLHLSSTEVDDMIRKSTNLLLTRTLASGLKTLVQKPSLGLNQLVQITVNTTYLENACPHVEEYVRMITGVRTDNAHSAKLVGVSTFKDARNETESQIYDKLNGKIDEFFDLAEYEWSMSEPQGLASRYLVDLINFLRTTFLVFTTLPANVAQTACMSACRHINTCLTGLILDPNVKDITLPALQQFNLDVIQCEHFANSEPVGGFDEGVLQMSFIEIRQLLDLILTWDWTSYFADYATPKSKYLRVNPAMALSLFEKIKQDKAGPRAYFTSIGRGKKKINDQVYKRLRSLVSEKPFEHHNKDADDDDEQQGGGGGRWSRFLNMVSVQ